MRIRCPICGRSQRVTESEIGLPTLCPACGARFDIAPTALATAPTTQDVDGLSDSAPAEEAAACPPHLTTLLWLAVVVLAFISGIRIGWVLHAVSGGKPNAPLIETAHTSLPAIAATSPVTPPITAHAATTRPSSAALPAPAATRPFAQAERLHHPVLQVAPLAKPSPAIAASVIRPVRPAGAEAPDLDQQIGQAIDRGTTYLLGRFKNGSLAGYTDMSKVTYSGLDALACYAVLQAGQATHNPRLGPHSPEVDTMLNALHDLPLDHQRETFPPSPGGPFTYAHSLRAAALSVFNRHDDRYTLHKDADWLLHAVHGGAYTYGIPPKLRGSAGDDLWDNSNSQYGALGVWSALQSEVEVPTAYWEQVEKHWLNCQLPNGQWGYAPGGANAELSMTVAGITTLFVTQDQLSLYEQGNTLGRPPFIPTLAKGLAWLESGDNSVSLPYTNRTYNLYGLERAALASGFKYFGSHDWYRELATGALRQQLSDGSWQDEDAVVDTAFTLLFLSRGRHPILMNKLRFDGSWSNRPRDVANLATYVSKELERPLNWQVLSLASDWTDWTDSPVLYIASHKPISLTDNDVHKLRRYAENGGLIYLQTDGQNHAFDDFAAGLASRLFPQYPLQALPPDHPLFATQYPLKALPKVQGVSNGSRLLLVHCQSDVNRAWQLRNWLTTAPDFQFGENLFIYAAGKSDFLNKLSMAYVPPPAVTPIVTVPIVRLGYSGNSDPEPAALQRWARVFLAHTSIGIDLHALTLSQLKPSSAPVALLTGTGVTGFSSTQVTAIHDYVAGGGVLLIDAAGGSSAFADSVRNGLLAPAFGAQPTPLHSSDPVLSNVYPGMTNVRLRLRGYLAEKIGSSFAPLEQLSIGNGRVIFSEYDLTTALLGTSTYPIDGYTPQSATSLLDNLVLWALQRPRG